MTILNIGKASYDITCPVDEYPIEGTKYLLNEKVESGGGTAANGAKLLILLVLLALMIMARN